MKNSFCYLNYIENKFICILGNVTKLNFPILETFIKSQRISDLNISR